jgi:hypothetical protein
MTAADVTRHHPTAKLLQIARHRVLRWFRPPEAEVRRARLVPHPLPTTFPAGFTTVHEAEHEQRS